MKKFISTFPSHYVLINALTGCNDLIPSVSMTIQNGASVLALSNPIDVMSIDSWEKFKEIDT